MSDYHIRYLNELFCAISELRNEDECASFFEDLCTVRELMDMAQRFETAVLLRQGQSYQQITEKIGISTATISRVNRCLSYGSGGYNLILERLKEKQNGDQ